jgi:hypothetical protein
MRKALLTTLFGAALAAAPDGAGFAQKKQGRCEQAAQTERNWEMIGQDYVYFDYVLCPADANSADPLVRVWITTRGDGIAVEKWLPERDGADSVSVFNGKKKAYTLYRDLNAVPLKVFKSERRSAVPPDMAGQPFLVEGSSLVPLENLTPDSAERAKKVLESADVLIRHAQRKGQLLRESQRIAAIVNTLEEPLKAQK